MSDTRAIVDAQEILTAVSAFVGTFDAWTLNDIGPHLTCTEVEVMAEVFRVSGYESSADTLIEGHAREDDEGDEHYAPEGEADDG
ncbi:hypothetical protein ACWD2L_05960 [Streptomyces sp. NPDC002754]